jgi:TetR/AcrR family transcriptional repressor of nem operon
MGRTKQYDRADLLDRAVELFRRQGFNGTSTAELVDELGVNRKTMYAEFGSKQHLFEATLAHYDRIHLTRVIGPLEAPDAGADTIRQAFAGYAAASGGWASGKGCLMCNTAVERGALEPGSRRFVDGYMDRLNRAFLNALGNARRGGDLPPTVDIGELAAYFTTALIGVAASIRAEASPDQVQAACRVATSVLDR